MEKVPNSWHKQLFECSTDGIVITDRHYRILFWNDAAAHLFGLRFVDVENMHLPTVLGLPGNPTQWTRDEHPFVKITPIEREDDHLFVCVERHPKQANSSALQDAINRQVVVSQLLARLPGTDMTDVVEEALHLLWEITGCVRSGVLLFDFDEGVADIVATYEKTDESTCATGLKRMPIKFPWLVDILRKHISHHVMNLGALASKHESEEHLFDQGMRSYFRTPIFVGDALVGMLFVDFDQPNAFRRAHIDIAEDVAAILAVAIRHNEDLRQDDPSWLVLRYSDTPMAILDDVGTVVRHNPAFRRALSCWPIDGNSLTGMLDPKAHSARVDQLREAIRTHTPHRTQVVVGQERVTLTMAVVPDLGFVVTLTEPEDPYRSHARTTERLYRDQLAKLIKVAEQDLRRPLSTILSSLALMDERSAHMLKIRHATQQMQTALDRVSVLDDTPAAQNAEALCLLIVRQWQETSDIPITIGSFGATEAYILRTNAYQQMIGELLAFASYTDALKLTLQHDGGSLLVQAHYAATQTQRQMLDPGRIYQWVVSLGGKMAYNEEISDTGINIVVTLPVEYHA